MNTAVAEAMRLPSTGLEQKVEVVSDYGSLLKLLPIWDELMEEAGIDHPFLSHEWIRTWWECFGAGKELHILLVKAGGKVQGIAPLMLSRGRIYGLSVRRLEFLHNVHTPRFDFVFARQPEEGCRAIWRHLLDQVQRWDVLELHQLPAGSPTLEFLPQIATDDGCLVGIWHGEDSPYLPFRGGWESYVKRLSYNHRAKVRKGLNRLARLGDVRLEVISAGERLAGALDDGLRIEAAAWKEKAGSAICCRPEVERFYKVFAERAACMGALRLLFLTVAGARIAFAYALCYRNKLYVLKAGYDPAYARYSPYNLLCYLVFRDGFERGLDEYEFLGSNEAWKLDWTQETRPHYWLFVFPPGLRTRFVYYAKFRLIPILQRQRLYVLLRDTLFGRNRRAGRSFWRAHRGAGVSDGEHLPQARS